MSPSVPITLFDVIAQNASGTPNTAACAFNEKPLALFELVDDFAERRWYWLRFEVFANCTVNRVALGDEYVAATVANAEIEPDARGADFSDTHLNF